MSNKQTPSQRSVTQKEIASKPVVLIIEEHEDSRSLLKTILTMKGCHVLEPVNFSHALQLANRVHPDLMIINIGLPTSDELEAVRQMRNSLLFLDIPLIITSADARASFQREVLAIEYTQLLVKPIDFDELDYLIEKYLFRRGNH